MEIRRHKPDKLDLDCDKVLDSVSHIKDTEEQIAVLLQCIDYLRMHVEYNKEKKHHTAYIDPERYM